VISIGSPIGNQSATNPQSNRQSNRQSKSAIFNLQSSILCLAREMQPLAAERWIPWKKANVPRRGAEFSATGA
jgi:hypothetical protein